MHKNCLKLSQIFGVLTDFPLFPLFILYLFKGRALILLETSALYKLFTYLLTYLLNKIGIVQIVIPITMKNNNVGKLAIIIISNHNDFGDDSYWTYRVRRISLACMRLFSESLVFHYGVSLAS